MTFQNNTVCQISGGPGKWELILKVFDNYMEGDIYHRSRAALSFKIERTWFAFSLKSVGPAPGSANHGSKFEIKGCFVDLKKANFGKYFTATYDLVSRTGSLTFD